MAMKYEDYPSFEGFGSLDNNPYRTDYREGIYVGYRWFQAMDIKPRYPFGFGLSYVGFDIKYSDIRLDKTLVSIDISVTNTSKQYDGKEIIQIYLSKPQGILDKEKLSLVAFKKTRLLKPNETDSFTATFDLCDAASYSEESASFILEKGEYGIFAGTNSADTKPITVISLDETVITRKLTNICPVKDKFEQVVIKSDDYIFSEDIPRLCLRSADVDTKSVVYETPGIDIKNDKVKECLDTFTANELIEVCIGGGYSQKVYNIISGVAGKTSVKLLNKGIPNINMADGPSGLYIMPKNAYTKTGSPRYVDELPPDWQWGWLKKFQKYVLAKPGKGLRAFHYMTAFPAPMLQAQSWNLDLIEDIGKAIGNEMLESGVSIWLAPGMNIHRNPLCGRNYEYYSEDPYISGVMAAAVTKGVQSHEGIGVCLKHLCCNNQEEKREYMTANANERALREIYLKGFSIAIKQSDPWCIMTSYNMVNSVYTPNSYDLCTKFLRNECGFNGVVMTDWNATEEGKANHELCLPSGNDLIMPGSKSAVKAIKDGLAKETIANEDLKRCAAKVLNMIFSTDVYRSDESL